MAWFCLWTRSRSLGYGQISNQGHSYIIRRQSRLQTISIMKLIYSEIKKLLPELSVDARKLRDDLTLIGHFVSGFEEVEDDYVLDLEIRQNRADCLGYYGIARDLAVYYHIKLSLPATKPLIFTSEVLPISINSPDVKRILATKISGIKVSPSPEWLVKLLAHHDINSINNLVDITNYAMILFGIPCHAFDTSKTTKSLIWENNRYRFDSFVSLDGTTLKLEDETLIISNQSEVLSLGFIGGQNSGIDDNTTETLIEMAVYNPSRIRSDSRHLKTITEASIRLDKFLDTETIPLGFEFLASQIIELCGGEVSASLFESYPDKAVSPAIHFDATKPSLYSGIEIPTDYSLDVLNRLGCVNNGDTISPPSIRKDIHLEEDLIEEVIRFYGYNNIPVNEPISSNSLTDITPKILYLCEKIKDNLVSLGYDEVRSWPLVKEPLSAEAIKTQNSINSEYPVLRQSITQSLQEQLTQYSKYKLINVQFFEIGKVFSQKDGNYLEKYALGVYHSDLDQLNVDLLKLGLTANISGNFAEIILDETIDIERYIPSSQTNQAIELTSQIITLDANISIEGTNSNEDLIKKYSSLIDSSILWSMEIVDVYQTRYTFRVSYYNCDDKTAKSVHLKTFNLN